MQALAESGVPVLLTPGVVHLDGGHDYTAVSADLKLWWERLASGGILIGDDYFDRERLWPEVRQAFDDFFGRLALPLEHAGGKCRIRKP